MKISQLRYFMTVCRYNNITKAAEELYVSQPAISSSIKDLETEFGVKLFYRQNNKLLLTDEGEYFLDKVTDILGAVDILSTQMKDLGNNLNHIKIGVPSMVGTFLFPAMFRAYKEKYPETEVEMQESGSLQVAKSVENNTLDLGIAIIDEMPSEKFNTLHICDTQLCFCVGAGHRLAKKESIDFTDLKDEKIILFKSDSYQHIYVKKAFACAGVEPQVMICSNQLYTIKKFLEFNNVGAFLFNQVAENDPEIIAIPLKKPINLSIGLIWNKKGNLYHDAENFIRFNINFKHRFDKQ